MNISAAQEDMRRGEVFGAPGVLVSGLVWISAGLVAWFHSFELSILALFFGGMVIFPVSTILSKRINPSYALQKTNPFVKLALEGTIFLFVGLLIAFTFSKSHPNLFYPIMLLTIGARYLTFQTLYGLKTYWVLGGTLLAIGCGYILWFSPTPSLAALSGGLIEIVFSVYLFKEYKKVWRNTQ